MKENTDLSNQIDAMVYQCQRMNAGKLRISFKREDGYLYVFGLMPPFISPSEYETEYDMMTFREIH